MNRALYFRLGGQLRETSTDSRTAVVTATSEKYQYDTLRAYFVVGMDHSGVI